jgi:hypothetical protein
MERLLIYLIFIMVLFSGYKNEKVLITQTEEKTTIEKSLRKWTNGKFC